MLVLLVTASTSWYMSFYALFHFFSANAVRDAAILACWSRASFAFTDAVAFMYAGT